MQPLAPTFSIIVCTRNRAEFLPLALEHLDKLTLVGTCELVFVDNGSTDQTAEVLGAFRPRSLSLRIVREPRPGLSRARNAGVAATTGSIIVFTDDDCYPQPDYLSALVDVFADPSIDYVGGRVLLHDPEDYPITIQLLNERVALPAGSYVPPGLIHGANFAARRRVIEAIGGFDELMGAGTRIPSGEDIDWIDRASAAGFSGVYDPRPVVSHHHRRRSPLQVEKLKRNYDIGRGAHLVKALLDRRRRLVTAKHLYWNLGARFGSRHALRSLALEMRGALDYLVLRATRKLVR